MAGLVFRCFLRPCNNVTFSTCTCSPSYEKALNYPQTYGKTLNNLATTYYRLSEWPLLPNTWCIYIFCSHGNWCFQGVSMKQRKGSKSRLKEVRIRQQHTTILVSTSVVLYIIINWWENAGPFHYTIYNYMHLHVIVISIIAPYYTL